MNDAAVDAIWSVLKSMEERLVYVEIGLSRVDGQIRARLKEEAKARQVLEDNIGGYRGWKPADDRG